MDKEEMLLYALDKIQMNNEVLILEENLENYKKVNNKLTIKSKEMIEELVKSNAVLSNEKKNLEQQIHELTMENNYLNQRLNRIPKFILKIFTNNNIKTLNGGK